MLGRVPAAWPVDSGLACAARFGLGAAATMAGTATSNGKTGVLVNPGFNRVRIAYRGNS